MTLALAVIMILTNHFLEINKKMFINNQVMVIAWAQIVIMPNLIIENNSFLASITKTRNKNLLKINNFKSMIGKDKEISQIA